jgi:hypothetical protein
MPLHNLCGKYGIVIMYAFGSRAAEIRAVVDGVGEVDTAADSTDPIDPTNPTDPINSF